MKGLISILVGVLSATAMAKTITCTGKLALFGGEVKVELNLDTGRLTAVERGANYGGPFSYFHSERTGRDTYFTPVGFREAIELELYPNGAHRLCVDTERCTVCQQGE